MSQILYVIGTPSLGENRHTPPGQWTAPWHIRDEHLVPPSWSHADQPHLCQAIALCEAWEPHTPVLVVTVPTSLPQPCNYRARIRPPRVYRDHSIPASDFDPRSTGTRHTHPNR